MLDDFDKLQEEAYEKAIADARARAERLARLSQVELGPIVAVREVIVPGDRADWLRRRDRRESGWRSAKFQEIPVRVELLVRFEVHSKSDGKRKERTTMNIPRCRIDRQPAARLSRRAFLDRSSWRGRAVAGAAAAGWRAARSRRAAEKEVLPKHVTPETLKAVIKGLDYLAAKQADDGRGSWAAARRTRSP